MDSASTEVETDLAPFFRIYKDGRVERYINNGTVPASNNPTTGVQSKDVNISPENNVSARLFLPKLTDPGQKLPLLIYIHGGAFTVESAFSPTYNSYLHSLTAEAKIIAVSIEYRLAPEHPIPACYDDSWAVINWVLGGKVDSWIKNHADLNRVFLAGDSAGANIAHNMVARASNDGFAGINKLNVAGLILIHPFFGNNKSDRIWDHVCSDSRGSSDPRLNPAAHPDLLSKLGCSKILICTAEKDFLRDRGQTYYETLKRSGWQGEVEIEETKGEDHVFHLFDPRSENAMLLLKRVASFINSVASSSL